MENQKVIRKPHLRHPVWGNIEFPILSSMNDNRKLVIRKTRRAHGENILRTVGVSKKLCVNFKCEN